MGTLKVNGSVNIQDLLTLKSGTDAYVTPSIAFGTDVLIGYGSTIKNLGIYSSNKIYLRPNNGTLGYSDGIELSTTSLIPTKNNTVALGDSSHKWSNIYATTFTGALSGNASSATKWATARTITIGHKAYTLDGSSNLTYSPVDIFWNTSTVNSATDWNAILTPGVQMVHGGDGFTGTGNPGNGHYPYGGLYTIGLGGTQEHGHIAQFYIPHNMSGAQGIVYRSGWYKTYVSWYTLLDSRNYTSYTVTKTGSGASGTWGINVTGSAGSVAWGNVTGKPSTFTPSSHTHSYLPLSGGTLTGTLTMNAQTGIQMVYRAGKDDVWIYPNGAPNFGIRYFEGDPDRMTLSATGNNHTTAGADLCINGNGDGTVTIRGQTIIHTGNIGSQSVYSASYSGRADTVYGPYSGNGGNQVPSYIGTSTTRFAMMRNFGSADIGGYMDCILMNNYSWSDVPYATGLGITKVNGYPRAIIANGPKDKWAYATELLTSYNYSWWCAPASHEHSYLVKTGESGGASHAAALANWFSVSKASIPRNCFTTMYSAAYGNGSFCMGYFLPGYDSNPYGGFFVAHYDKAWYVQVNGGIFLQKRLLTGGSGDYYGSSLPSAEYNGQIFYLLV